MINLPENIRGLLDSSIARVRRIYLLRGIAATLAALLFATLVMMAIDAKLTLFSETARWLLSSLVYLVVAAVSYFSIVRPLLAKIDRLRVAKILDGRHPEHEEALTTIVELSVEAAVTGRLSCSQTLFEVLSRKAEAAARAIDIEREFTTRTIVRRLKWLGAAIAALTISLVAVPHVAGRLFLRAVAPWVDVGNLYANDIEVVPEPAYSDCKIILNHPEYTGRPPTTYTNTADIVGLVGTKVFVDIKASRSGLTGEANFPDVRVPCEQGANNRMKFALTLTPKSAGNWFIALGDQNGFSNTLQTAKVQIIEDTPPLVALADEIPTEVKLMKTGDMSLLYTIKEDFSLASVALEMLTGTTWEEIAVLSPEKSDSVTWTGVARAIFADKDLSKVNRLRLRIRATDTRPAELGGPGIGYSPEVSIVFVNNRTSLAQQSLNSQIKEADDLIRQVTISFENTIRYLENARHFTDTVEWRRHNSLNQLKGAKTHASGTENSLTTLISSLKDTPLDDGIPLFQPVLDDHVTPDRARVEDIYLITEPSDKDAAVGESRKTWIEDLALFKEAARKFKVLSEAARELQKLADFAEREKLLAELAEQEKLTAEEFAKKENELLEEFKRDFNERLRDLDFTREKKDLDLMQKRLDTLKNKQKEFQDRLEATSPDNEEENKRIRSEQNSLADQIRRQDQELEHVLNRVEQKVGNASEDQMETAQPLKEARNDLSDANDQAMDALQEMRNGNHEDAKKAMEATQENLTDAQQKVSNAKNRMDEKERAECLPRNA